MKFHIWRKPPSRGTALGSDSRTDGSEAFVEIAESLARFHMEASTAVETKATALLGFTGIALTLTPVLASRVKAPIGCWDRIAIVATAASVLLLAASAVWCARVLMGQRVNYPAIRGFAGFFQEHTRDRWSRDKVMGTWAKAMYRTEEGEDAGRPLMDIQRLAQTRTQRFKVAVALLLAAIGTLTVAALILLLDAII